MTAWVRRAVLAVLAAVTVAVLPLSGCASHQPTPTRSQLVSLAVSGVRYPSAELVTDGGPDSNNKFGRNGAEVLRTWATSDPSAEVYSFYDAQMAKTGWVRSDNAGVFSDDWVSAHMYTSGKRVFAVAVEKPEAAARVKASRPNLSPAGTVFQTSLQ